MIRLLVADDQNLIRHALQVYLETEKDLEVVGSAQDGQTTLEQIEALNPDVVLLDIEMPGMNGLNTTQIICHKFPETRVLVLSSHDDEYYVNQALKMGAKGYLLKNTAAEDLANVIRSVHKGYFQLGPGLSEKLAGSLINPENNPEIETLLKEKIETHFQEIQKKIAKNIEMSFQDIQDEIGSKTEENNYKVMNEVASQMKRFQTGIKNEIINSDQSLDYQEVLDQQKGLKAQILTIRGYYKELEKKLDKIRTALSITVITLITMMILTLLYVYNATAAIKS